MKPLERRAFLGRLLGGGGVGFLASQGLSTATLAASLRPRRLPRGCGPFLEELQRTSFRFFQEATHPVTGQILDRKRADGESDSRGVASIAATGFGLTAVCIAEQRGWIGREEAREQVLRTLRHLRHDMGHVRGFFYHFHDWSTGERIWKCELSSIDTTILLCGALACRAHFRRSDEQEIRKLATELYERVEWPWMLNGSDTFSMGWLPEAAPGRSAGPETSSRSGGGRFLKSRWDHYCELMMLYLLALGSPTHPVEVQTWRAWSRPIREYHGRRFVWSPAPLFVHQFSHAWFDFRDRLDDGVDWFENSVEATHAHRAWCLERSDRFPLWSEDLWGVTSSDSRKGYTGWGGPPDSGPLDGTIVPCAAAGSLPFVPTECLRTLRHQRERFGDRIWKRYGFVDAFNPHTGWVNPDVIGIDVGITVLMAENARTGFVWKTMKRDKDLQRGMERAFRSPT
jgi:hypothetical protein